MPIHSMSSAVVNAALLMAPCHDCDKNIVACACSKLGDFAVLTDICTRNAALVDGWFARALGDKLLRYELALCGRLARRGCGIVGRRWLAACGSFMDGAAIPKWA